MEVQVAEPPFATTESVTANASTGKRKISEKPSDIFTVQNATASLTQFVETLRDRGIPVDADLVTELQRNVKSWGDVIRRQRGLGSSLYAIPKPMNRWGEKQEAHHINWADLFFDLTFVASSFRLGQLLESVVITGLTVASSVEYLFMGGFLFTALFVLTRSVWESKLQYSSRFHSGDLLHKVFDILEATLTAVLAVNIPTSLESALDYQKTIWLFAFVRLSLFLANGIRWLEVTLLSKSRASRLTGLYFLTEALTNSVLMAGSIVLIAFNQPIWAVSILFLVADTFFVVDVIRAIFNKWNTKDNTTPLHVGAVVHREGDFTMLMIGEGVLSIIVLQTGPDLALYYPMFVTAYLILATIQVLHYSSQPAFPEGHALFRSRIRGVLWLKLQTIESGLIVVVGVALKILLKLGTKADQEEYWPIQWLLCIALSLIHLLLQVFQVLHAGIAEELDVPWCAKWIKLALYAFKAFLALLFLFMPLAHAEALPLFIGCLLIGIIATIAQRAWEAVDTFVASASALAAEDANSYNDRVVEVFDEPKDNDEARDDISELNRDDTDAESILLKMLPRKLKSKRVESELKRLHALYGSSQLQRELAVVADRLAKVPSRNREGNVIV